MIYIFLADGFEDIEALTPCDALRRCGADVATVGVTGEFVTSSHGVTVKADIVCDAVKFDDIDGIILPGGMPGTLNLKKDETVNRCIDFCYEHKKMIAAICAAPSILGEKGLLEGKNAICYPGFEQSLKGAVLSCDSVVTDGNIITAKGAGVSWEFSAAIISLIYSKEKAKEITESVQCRK